MITSFLEPNKVTKTMYGEITNKEWINREKARLESAGRKCAVITQGGYVGLECTMGVAI